MSTFTFDPGIIPDKKERYKKEAFEYLKRAFALHDAITYLKLNREKIKIEAVKFAMDLHMKDLIGERDRLMDEGIKSYMEFKKNV